MKLTPKKKDGILLVHGVTGETSKKVAVAEAIDLQFGKESHEVTGKKNLRVIRLEAEAGKTYTFYKYFAVFTDNDPVETSVIEAAIETVREAKACGYDQCLKQHNAHWAKKWEYCDVKIDASIRSPKTLSPVTMRPLRASARQATLESWRALQGTLLIPLDGTWYYSSQKIHCQLLLPGTQKRRKNLLP